ncbi:MAG: BaiN/RdsA family NAD(P)/FAD-dependent oxidoreductase [Phycisphaerales bacterium]
MPPEVAPTHYDTCDIAIIGAGAAGLATAIFAAQALPPLPLGEGRGEGTFNHVPPHPRIILLDSSKLPGAGSKILVSGGGRCNVTHDIVTPDDYHGHRPIVRNILAAFSVQQTIDWFASLGVTLKREPGGKLFPTTDNAHTVLNALLRRCDQLGVIRLADHRVTECRMSDVGCRMSDDAASHPTSDIPHPTFHIRHSHGSLTARRLVLATGGRSLPRSGSDGSGYRLAQSLGHSVTDTHQALVPLLLAPSFFHTAISGISCEAEFSVFVENRVIERRAGSMLWTHQGISGPAVMDISRAFVIAHDQRQNPVLRVNLLPGDDFASCEKTLIDLSQQQPRAPLHRIYPSRLPQRLIDALLQHLHLDASLPLGQLTRDDRRRLAHALTELEPPVTGPRGWNYAEVTAGGVPLNQIDPRTMQSRVCPGLHLVGEILDCDGRIGGFNFQWAWTTARLAGTALAKTI